LKTAVLRAIRSGTIGVLTDPLASPTGFPFKVVQLGDTLSNALVYDQRSRVCDLAYLRHAYSSPHGGIGWRCPAEPLADYLRKGGEDEDTVGRKCLCNALMANIGLGQVRRQGDQEMPLLTSGVDVASVTQFLKASTLSYSARDVIEHLLSGANSLAHAAGGSPPGYCG
jgi:nitronate monooxygenase